MKSDDVFRKTPRAMGATSNLKFPEGNNNTKQETDFRMLHSKHNDPVSINNNVDRQYNDLFRKILEEGQWQKNRTGLDSQCIFGEQIKMDLREGFPIFTTRKMPFEVFAGELRCFIQGYTSKTDFKEHGCFWWESWCNPQKVPYGNDEETKALMKSEDDLGVVYGYQWRSFSDPRFKRVLEVNRRPMNEDNILYWKEVDGVDQLKILVEKIRAGIDDRRLIVNYWNPLALEHQGLPCCHYSFTVHLSPCGEFLDLKWNQRSVDLALGANNTLYGILAHLLAHECGRTARYLIASYENVHIYENQVDVVKEQLKRPTHKLPTLKLHTDKFNDIFDWSHKHVELVDYKHSGILKYPQAAI